MSLNISWVFPSANVILCLYFLDVTEALRFIMIVNECTCAAFKENGFAIQKQLCPTLFDPIAS